MIDQLVSWDKSIFIIINSCYSDYWDKFFWLFTQKETWIPLYLALLFIIVQTKKKDAVWIILGLLIIVLLSDQVSSGLIKPIVERLRPSHEPSLTGLVHLINGYTGGSFGFVSSHAANSFGLALFSSLLFRNRLFSISIFSWAIINSYSRIYIGVHYPLDIICGALVGLVSAWSIFFVLSKYRPEVMIFDSQDTSLLYRFRASFVIAIMLFVLLFIAIYSLFI